MSGKLQFLIYSLYVVVLLLVSSIEPGPLAAGTNSANSVVLDSRVKTNNDNNVECNLAKANDIENKLLKIINTMKGRKYEWEDKEHKYYFSVCSKASTLAPGDTDGIIQVNKLNNNTYVLGRLNDVDLEGVENIIRMTYNDGDNYQRACNQNKRTSVIYFVCDPNQKEDKFTLIDENNDRDTDRSCAYIFELKTSMVCNQTSTTTPTSTSSLSSTTTTIPTTTKTQSTQTTSTTTLTPVTKPSSSSSSSSSSSLSSTASSSSSSSPSSNKISNKLGVIPVILISLTSVLAVYFIFGAIYQRYVNRARGWEQIPNYTLWLTIGNRFNECCRGNRATQIHSYENINDRISDDENLLN